MKTSAQESRQITIFDTTLRDGEQSPGCAMTLEEKLKIAAALRDLGVDVIEAGFPIASEGDFRAVAEIARTIEDTRICALARCLEKDIDAAWEAIRDADNPRIHVFLATSALHRDFKLQMTPDEIIRFTTDSVRYAVAKMRDQRRPIDVEFSPEDATRTEMDFLCQVVEEAIRAGATTVNIPDTVGYATPQQMSRIIETLRQRVPGIERAAISVHCHDDLGLAVANSLAAVEAGADQVECTINGIGERAGNCSNEEIVMAMRVRADQYRMQTRIRSALYVPTSQLVAAATNPIQRHKAIVGRNAFAHAAGIHQDGVNAHPGTYEIMTPESVGWTESSLPLTKHSGRKGIHAHLEKMGLVIRPEDLAQLATSVKAFAEDRERCPAKEVTDDELVAMLADQVAGPEPYLSACVRPEGRWEGRKHVVFTVQNTQRLGVARTPEEGAINALVEGVRELWKQQTGEDIEVVEPGIRTQSKGGQPGSDAPAVSTITLKSNGLSVSGSGESTDNEEAGLRAVQNAVNRLWALCEYQLAVKGDSPSTP